MSFEFYEALVKLGIDTWQMGVKLSALRSGASQGQNTPRSVPQGAQRKTDVPLLLCSLFINVTII